MQLARSAIGIRNLECVRSPARPVINRYKDDEHIAPVVNDACLRSSIVTNNFRLAVKASTSDSYLYGEAPSGETIDMTTVKARGLARRWVL